MDISSIDMTQLVDLKATDDKVAQTAAVDRGFMLLFSDILQQSVAPATSSEPFFDDVQQVDTSTVQDALPITDDEQPLDQVVVTADDDSIPSIPQVDETTEDSSAITPENEQPLPLPVIAWLAFQTMQQSDPVEDIQTEPSKIAESKLELKPKEQATQNTENRQTTDQFTADKVVDKGIIQGTEQTNTKVAKSEYKNTEQLLIETKTSAIEPNKVDMTQLQHTQSNSVSHTQMKSLNINTPIQQKSEWGEQFGQQIAWMGKQQIKSAMIHLNPRELGPISISVRVHDDTASLQISSQHQQVRDMIGESLPRLREMLADQGLNLGDVQLESKQQGQQNADDNKANQHITSPWLSEEELSDEPATQLVIKKGLIDYFA